MDVYARVFKHFFASFSSMDYLRTLIVHHGLPEGRVDASRGLILLLAIGDARQRTASPDCLVIPRRTLRVYVDRGARTASRPCWRSSEGSCVVTARCSFVSPLRPHALGRRHRSARRRDFMLNVAPAPIPAHLGTTTTAMTCAWSSWGIVLGAPYRWVSAGKVHTLYVGAAESFAPAP